jgi:hypothetical protein
MTNNGRLADGTQTHLAHRVPDRSNGDVARGQTNDNVTKRNRSSLSGLAAGVFIGGILGTVAAMWFALGSEMQLGLAVPKTGARDRRMHLPESPARAEEIHGTNPHGTSARWWRAVFWIASGLAVYADSRMKKRS